MAIIFLSDAHLMGPMDPAHLRLLRFLGSLMGRGAIPSTGSPIGRIAVDRLVIAGDFFDFWFARGEVIYPGFRPVVERLRGLRDEGVTISLCEGNHDFSLGEYFAGRLGFEVYPEWADFTVDGLRLLVAHGDTVDRGNRKYLALRALLRSPILRGLERTLPLRFLWRAARFSSSMGKGTDAGSAGRLAEVMHRFARAKFREGYDAVILGHCHRAILRQEVSGGRVKSFAALGDWLIHDSYLLYEEGSFSLQRYSSNGSGPHG